MTTLRSNVPVTIPVPKDTLQRLEAGDVCEHTWHRGVGVAEADTKRCDATRSIKLNMGFCLFRRTEARPIFEGWAAASARASRGPATSSSTTNIASTRP